jgi:ribosomal protein L2
MENRDRQAGRNESGEIITRSQNRVKEQKLGSIGICDNLMIFEMP